jgi:hypothetical protein
MTTRHVVPTRLDGKHQRTNQIERQGQKKGCFSVLGFVRYSGRSREVKKEKEKENEDDDDDEKIH